MTGARARRVVVVAGIAAIVLGCRAPARPPAGASSPPQAALWPEVTPFQTGYLRVSEIHELYYEESGSREGQPVVYLHGGPGGQSSPYARRFFNPAKFRIVLYDQRGAGKSRPFGELRDNNTWTLVDDLERLRRHLALGKMVLFGGSWGSTLALAYAEKYPDNVAGLILRGVFTATKAEIDHYYHGGVQPYFPREYAALLAALPDPDRRPLPAYLHELLTTSGPAERRRYAAAWARYEIKVSGLNVSDADVEAEVRSSDPYAFAVLENYYMANGCFLEEGQLLRDAAKIARVPTTIVNGRYDVICPLVTAYRLHRALPRSKLVIAEEAGHWMGEKPVERELLQAVRAFEP